MTNCAIIQYVWMYRTGTQVIDSIKVRECLRFIDQLASNQIWIP